MDEIGVEDQGGRAGGSRVGRGYSATLCERISQARNTPGERRTRRRGEASKCKRRRVTSVVGWLSANCIIQLDDGQCRHTDTAAYETRTEAGRASEATL